MQMNCYSRDNFCLKRKRCKIGIKDHKKLQAVDNFWARPAATIWLDNFGKRCLYSNTKY